MNIIELKSRIDTVAFGPRGTQTLQEASAQASPPMAIKITFEHLQGRSDRDDTEAEILRDCCKLIRVNKWFGLAQEAAKIEAALPPPPAPPATPLPMAGAVDLPNISE